MRSMAQIISSSRTSTNKHNLYCAGAVTAKPREAPPRSRQNHRIPRASQRRGRRRSRAPCETPSGAGGGRVSDRDSRGWRELLILEAAEGKRGGHFVRSPECPLVGARTGFIQALAETTLGLHVFADRASF